MSFASWQFSLDSAQLQFKPYASKLAFLGQETRSVKITTLWVALVCKGRPGLPLCYTLGTSTAQRKQAIWGSSP